MTVALNKNEVLNNRYFNCTLKSYDCIFAEIAIRTHSEGNGGASIRGKRENWRQAWKRHKNQKILTKLALRDFQDMLQSMPKDTKFFITLHRYAPNKLDKHDNLPSSFKYILDAVCEVITGDLRPGRADGGDNINVIYGQSLFKEYYITIEIKFDLAIN